MLKGTRLGIPNLRYWMFLVGLVIMGAGITLGAVAAGRDGAPGIGATMMGQLWLLLPGLAVWVLSIVAIVRKGDVPDQYLNR